MSSASVALLAAGVAAVAGGVGGWQVPRVVAWLPRPRDLAPDQPGPDYSRLAAVPGLRTAALLAGLAVGAVLGYRLGVPVALPYLHLLVLGMPLGYVDVRVHRLPDALVLPALPMAVALVGVVSVATGEPGRLGRALLGMAVAYVGFGGLHLISPAGFGRGDVKLGAWTALLTAWLSWPGLLIGVASAIGLGGFVALAVLAAGGSRRSAIPFGPMLLVGAIISAVSGSPTG